MVSKLDMIVVTVYNKEEANTFSYFIETHTLKSWLFFNLHRGHLYANWKNGFSSKLSPATGDSFERKPRQDFEKNWEPEVRLDIWEV